MPRKKGDAYRIDLSGSKFGKWTVKNIRNGNLWLCECDCGTQKMVTGSSLKLGTSTSCGCSGKDWCRTHGMEGTREYNTWGQMIQRCQNPKAQQYKNYGGRGIKVCERWRDFPNFFADMGYKPEGLSLDRINNDGDYEPSNCRWANFKEQMNNRRRTIMIEYQGKKIPISELSELTGIKRKVINSRIKSGYSIEQITSKDRLSRWTKGK